VIVARRLRAPRTDGAVVAEPPLTEVAALLGHNRQHLGAVAGTVLGRSWPDVRQQARQAALAAAEQYFLEHDEPLPPDLSASSLILAGHQPGLFHPGVWAKNFALNQLAGTHGATPLNLIVDNDTARTNVLRMAALDGPTVRLVPFDQGRGELPFEERRVLDENLFASFAERAASITTAWPFRPLLPDFWAEVMRQAKRTPLLGQRFVGARRVFERRWGCHNLEVPLSMVCRTEPFAWFVCHFLADLPRFHAVYNEAVHTYRRVNGIRSRNHPVPDLAREGDWLEVPLWAWRTDRPHRGRVMVRPAGHQLQLRIDREAGPSIPSPAHDAAAAIGGWLGLEAQGWKVRTRALTTTLFARLFLADLFIHGIGGGKYDELTDEIIQRFYGFEAPGFLVLSATLWLPFQTPSVRPEDCALLAQRQRDVHWNPQRHLPSGARADGNVQALLREKHWWIEQQPGTHAGRKERFRKLQELTARLRAYVTAEEKASTQQLNECHAQARANAVLHNREYAFCLFPQEELRTFCRRFLQK